MKKIIALAVAVSLAAASFAADKPKFEPYGFVKGDMYITSGGVTSWKNPGITSASRATGLDTDATSFTAQHSRLGFKGTTTIDSVAIGGLIEVDFFTAGGSNANNKPRMRLAYAWVKPIADLEIRTGQDWDLFSPLNPTTNNTNANLWYNGNYGFRRSQIEVRYNRDLGAVKPSVQLSVGETTREDELAIKPDSVAKNIVQGTYLGTDNLGIPLIQGRLSAKFAGTMEVGVAGLFADYGAHHDFYTSGISVDANLPLHKLCNLKGEFAIGKNLDNANIFTVGGAGSADKDIENSGVWFDVTSKICPHFQTVVGFGNESITSALAKPTDLKSNMTVYGDLVFPMGEFFSFCAEYQWIQSTPNSGDAFTASVVDVSGKIVF